MQLSFMVTMLAGCFQSLLLRNPRFRTWWGLPPIINPASAAAKSPITPALTANPSPIPRTNLKVHAPTPTAPPTIQSAERLQSAASYHPPPSAIETLRASLAAQQQAE